MSEEDMPKTALTTRRGLFEFQVMPFGLYNALLTFERLMEAVLAGLHRKISLVDLDDVTVVRKTLEDMLQHLGCVFQRFEDAGLKLKPSKCKLCKGRIPRTC